jgi:uncharacterized membrane protein (UPF0127 family)
MSITNLRRAAILFCLSLAGIAPAGAQLLMELSIGPYRVETEIANSEESRQLGLMHRKKMAQNHGMLFVFNQPEQYCMWMKNTLIPLAVAFIDQDGIIVDIEEMRPQTEDIHCSSKAVKFALEMNSGWFKNRGIEPGSRIGGIDHAPQAM